MNRVIKYFVIVATVMAISSSCSEERFERKAVRNAQAAITGVAREGKLSLQEYTVKKSITVKDSSKVSSFLERGAIYIATAHIRTGFDFTSQSPEIISADMESKSITIKLPSVQVLSFRLPYNEFERVYRFGIDYSSEERNKFFRECEKRIEAEDFPWIKEDATKKAEGFFNNLLSPWFKDVTIIIGE